MTSDAESPRRRSDESHARRCGNSGVSDGPVHPPLALRLKRQARNAVDDFPRLTRAVNDLRRTADTARLALSRRFPALLRARPRKLTIAITANCNLRCSGCRYGRDFMAGAQLPLSIVRSALIDAAEAGVESVRIYGGEPLLHRHLAQIVATARDLGLSFYITTNGLLLGKRARELREAGLRDASIGLYGSGAHYDAYVQKPDRFAKLEASLRHVRDVFGSELRLQLNFLLMRPTCSVEALDAAWSFAERHDMRFTVDLVHYSLPYFVGPEDASLQLGAADEARIRRVVERLLQLRAAHPDRYREPLESVRSIPDWLLLGRRMRVPCDAEKLIWVGADGSVQLCYAAFPLGNLHQSRLRDLVFTPDHHDAARRALRLDCPNCHCERADRIMKHPSSRTRYGVAPAPTLLE